VGGAGSGIPEARGRGLNRRREKRGREKRGRKTGCNKVAETGRKKENFATGCNIL